VGVLTTLIIPFLSLSLYLSLTKMFSSNDRLLIFSAVVGMWHLVWGIILNSLLLLHVLQWPIAMNAIMGCIEAGLAWLFVLVGLTHKEQAIACLSGVGLLWASIETQLVWTYVYGSNLPEAWPPAFQRMDTVNVRPSLDGMVDTRMLIHFFVVIKALVLTSLASCVFLFTWPRPAAAAVAIPVGAVVPRKR
jgi:hypothetical protein